MEERERMKEREREDEKCEAEAITMQLIKQTSAISILV